MPLPPSIIPESEDPIPSPVSEVSSGYISTSLSTATLSDVYTLSWDLPPLSTGRTDGFEAVLDDDEEDSTVTYPQSVLMDKSGAQESVLMSKDLASAKLTGLTQSEPDITPPDSKPNDQDANLSSSVQMKEQGEFDSVVLCQQEHEEDSLLHHRESENVNDLEPPKDSLLEDVGETKQIDALQKDPSEAETSQKEEEVRAATDKTEAEESLHHVDQEVKHETVTPETQQPNQDNTTLDKSQDADTCQSPDVSKELEQNVVSTGDLGSKEQGASEASNPCSPQTPALPSTTDECKEKQSANLSSKATTAPDPSLSCALPSKPNASVANPFKIQKVKSSDLHSFQGIIERDEDKSQQVDPASSLGAGLNLAVPMESLEIISDSEGDAAVTVLPDWLKEGEFVTVGTNKCGTVRYVGPTDFAEGTWVGVELEVPAGGYNTYPEQILHPVRLV